MEEIKSISITDKNGNLIANIAIKWETKEIEVISDKEYEVVEMNEVSDKKTN
ncbi:hypothetical protein [Fusobacterium gastrosuis]|uniref:hypothetical protein n=1 Tax=Fusobacterium gastrosuis TaxID=1755100 RepID=UPI0025CCFB69|nr:hypothetical protein [uncultured Fusobacterium sp.]MDD7410172.1 hypothetical protein [Fusobacteriaceae bacterium]MDY5713861.1 hypothetical protein [Fusobacterium gastrosuis]